MLRLRLLAPLLAVLALSFAACGGSGGSGNKDETQIRSAVTDYVGAFVSKDAAKACSLLTEGAKQRLAAQAGEAGSSCEKTLGRVVNTLVNQRVASQLKRIKVDSVKIDGDTATIDTTPNFGGQSKPTEMKKVDGQWLVNGDAQ